MKHRLTDNLGLKLLSLLAAVVFWLVVVNIDDPVTVKRYSNIPVIAQNESVILNQGKIYQIMNNSGTVTVSVSAKRSTLRQIRSDDITVYADFQNMELSSMIPLQVVIRDYEGLYESATCNPNNMVVSIEDSTNSRFAITSSTTGDPADGYFVSRTDTNPESITVSGPGSVVNSIDKVTVVADVTGLSANTTMKASPIFYNAKGEVIDSSLLSTDVGPEGISVSIIILEEKVVPIRASTSGTPAYGFMVDSVVCEPDKVAIRGTQEAMDALDEIVIPARAINVSGFDTNMENVIDITELIPGNLEIADEKDQKILVTIKIRAVDVMTVSVPVASIVVKNAPDGYKVDYGTRKEISLKIQGDKDVLDSLKDTDIKVTMDLTDCQTEGSYSLPLKLTSSKEILLSEDVTLDFDLVKEDGE